MMMIKERRFTNHITQKSQNWTKNTKAKCLTSGIETVELPAGIKKICECAFDRCNIRRISLPAAVELGSDAISEVSEIHVEDGEHLPHGIIQSMSKYNGLAKYITPDSNLVVKITQDMVEKKQQKKI